MITKILIGIVVVVAVFCAVTAMQPEDFSVKRSAVIEAPPEKIFELVNTLKNWNSWSPWIELDPDARTTFEGPPSGVGAIMRWDGNYQVGAGSLTIIESRAPQQIKMRLDFFKPMKGTNAAEFDFAGKGSQTTVTWSMQGKNNFIAKAMNLILNCEKMVGGQFEKGLANLKKIAEK